ncbi:hypothetical protein MMC30_001700 [Trapelia coarctata]|nr:hypothetical protein [Trapelia coarctata]
MPDYPSTNPGGLNYFKMLWSIVTITIHVTVLIQACIVGFFTSSIFTNFWTTLTFLLASPPYNYDAFVISLFALIGIASLCLGPPYSCFIIDKFVPLFSVVLGLLICLTGIAVGTYTGTFTVAGPVIQAFALDLGLQTSQIANRSAIYAIAPKAQNRVNTAFMVSVFCGQLMGTAVGNDLYAKCGWIRSGSASVGFIGAALLVCFVRGPWETGWAGWRGRGRGEGSPASKGGPALEIRSSGVFELRADVGVCESVTAGSDGIVDGTVGSIGAVTDCFGNGVWHRMGQSKSAGCEKRKQKNEAAGKMYRGYAKFCCEVQSQDLEDNRETFDQQRTERRFGTEVKQRLQEWPPAEASQCNMADGIYTQNSAKLHRGFAGLGTFLKLYILNMCSSHVDEVQS